MSKLIDNLSEYFAVRKGLLPIIGILFIVLNLFLQFIPLGWFAWLQQTNLFLHFGLIIAIFGLMLAWVL
jgi:hypothetical protein